VGLSIQHQARRITEATVEAIPSLGLIGSAVPRHSFRTVLKADGCGPRGKLVALTLGAEGAVPQPSLPTAGELDEILAS
jgi:hypothetical protein